MLDVAMVFAIGGNPAERRGFFFFYAGSLCSWFAVQYS